MPATRKKTAAPAPASVEDTAVSSSLRNLAYERFRQQILDGRLRAGQFVSQRELVRLLDVPLGAVREKPTAACTCA